MYTTPPFQIGRHPTHERHIGLPGPVNHVFSILITSFILLENSPKKQWNLSATVGDVYTLYLIIISNRGALKKKF